MIRETYQVDRGTASASLTLEIYEEEGRTICGLYQLTGTLPFPPKAWLKLIRTEIRTIERIAREAGCAELRLGGRDWSRILPDYEPLENGTPNGLKKRL